MSSPVVKLGMFLTFVAVVLVVFTAIGAIAEICTERKLPGYFLPRFFVFSVLLVAWVLVA